MSKKEIFKIVLISIIFAVSLIVVLPEIPLVVNSKLWVLDSSIGGLQIKIPQKNGDKIIDLGEFKKGSGIGENQKITFKLTDENLQNKEEVLSETLPVIKKRLTLSGISEARAYIENGGISVVIPEYEDSTRINQLVSGSGKIIFRTVKNPEDWNQEQFQSFYLEKDRWEDTDVTEADVQRFTYVLDAQGNQRLQIVFTTEGRAKFYKVAADNINLPVAVYVSDFDYPFLMPLIGENILDNPSMDPAVGASYPQQLVDDYNLQISNSLPSGISYANKVALEPVMGSGFIEKYLIAFLVSLFLISIFFLVKFNTPGLIFSYSLFISLLVFIAVAKILYIPISIYFIVTLVLVTGIMSGIGYTSFRKIKNGLAQGTPFEILQFQVLRKEKGILSVPSILILTVSFVLAILPFGNIRPLMSAIVVGMLSVILFYSFILPALVGALGGNKK